MLSFTIGFGQDNLEVDGRATINRNGEALRMNGVNNWISFYNGVQYNGYINHTNMDLNLMNIRQGALSLGTNAFTRMTITEDGQVGIGTNTPAVNSILHATGGSMRFEPWPSGGAFTGDIRMVPNLGLTPSLIISDGTTDVVSLGASGFSRIINSLVLGATNAGDYKMKILHDGFGLNLENSLLGNENDWEIYSESSANGRLSLFNNSVFRGSFNGTTGVYTPTSSLRLKKNVKKLESVLVKVMQLQPTRFQVIEDDVNNKESIGFSAQDVKEIFPELVFSGTDARTKGLYTMDNSGFGIIAIKAIQEQQQVIESLQTQNKKVVSDKVALEERVESLEQKLDALIIQVSSKK